MKIGVEATALVNTNRTGVAHYTYFLIKSMAALDPENHFILPYLHSYPKATPDLGFSKQNNVTLKRIGYFPGRLYSGLFRYLIAPPIDLLGAAFADIYLFPNFARWPLISTRKSAVIIYDLSFVHSPDTCAARLRSYLTRFVPKAIDQSQLVITISQNTKREIVDAYSIHPDKVVVATPAVDHSFFYPRSRQDAAEVLRKYGIPDRSYILFTGTIEPRKNLAGLLSAYERIDRSLAEQFPLVLVGGKGWLDDEIHQQIERLLSNGYNIVQTGYAPYDELPLLYSRARTFVFPSLYEGFGMPPLEAMACGTPVITSSNSSLPEVVGNAGLLVDATNEDQLATALEELLTNDARSDRMAKLGLIQAHTFTWEDSASIVLNALARI